MTDSTRFIELVIRDRREEVVIRERIEELTRIVGEAQTEIARLRALGQEPAAAYRPTTPRPPRKKRRTPAETVELRRRILNLFGDGQELSTAQIAERTGLRAKRVLSHLKALKADGRIDAVSEIGSYHMKVWALPRAAEPPEEPRTNGLPEELLREASEARSSDLPETV